jgi:hypothetical protein
MGTAGVASLLAVTLSFAPIPEERFFGEAARTAPVIVFGQVERLERSFGSTVATLRVEYAGRGARAPSLEFEAQNSQHAEVVTLGEWALVFLQPRDGGALLEVLADGGGAFRAFAAEGQPYLVRGRHDPQFSIELCSRSAGNLECAAKLTDLLRSAGLPPFNPPDAGEATFQVVGLACEPCELEPWLDRYSDAGLCAGGPGDAGVTATYACVRDAVKRRAAFKAVVKDALDPLGADAFVSQAGKAYAFHFTSRVDGDCSAQAQVTECSALKVRLGKRLAVDCVGRQDTQILCSQRRARSESLGPAQPVARLSCAEGAGGEFLGCSVGPADAGFVRPPRDGPHWVCRSDEPRACRPTY